MRHRKTVILLAALLVLMIAALTLTSAQVRGKRLILKDGSYQIAEKWEIKGDRVRYYSRERLDWEEVPNSLVDWDATNKFNAKVDAPQNNNPPAEIVEVDKEEAAERAHEAAKTPEVAPGVRLPDSGGVYMLDTYRGQGELVELVQNGGELNKQTGKNIMRAVINPISVSKQTVEIKGLKSRVQAHVAQPEIFLDIDVSDEEKAADSAAIQSGAKAAPANRFQIIRLDKTKNSRIVGDLKIYMYGKVKQEQKMIDTASDPLPGNEWVKIYPKQPLSPGEYAVVEMVDPKQMNLYVWDFGIDPGAPENPASWKAAPSPPASREGGNKKPK